MSNYRAYIKSVGCYLPEKILTNDDLSKLVSTSDEWITERTGIKQRHIAADGEYTSDLAYKAAKQAIDRADIDASSIDMIIVATTTPDRIFPATATKVQNLLGLKNIPSFDLQAVCSGFVYALNVAEKFIIANSAKRILVIGAETISRILNWEDRNTCVLFGDGAGAVIVEQTEEDKGIISSSIYADGEFIDILCTDGGPSMTGGAGVLTMQGKDVFKHAVNKMSGAVENSLEKVSLTSEDISLLVPHQANQRILTAVAKKLKLREDQVISTVAKHANTSSASIPLALDVAIGGNRIKSGDIVVLEALGAGLTWGSIVIKW